MNADHADGGPDVGSTHSETCCDGAGISRSMHNPTDEVCALRSIAAKLYNQLKQYVDAPATGSDVIELEVRLCRVALPRTSPTMSGIDNLLSELLQRTRGRLPSEGLPEPILYLPFDGQKHGVDVGVSEPDFKCITRYVYDLHHANHGTQDRSCQGNAKGQAENSQTPPAPAAAMNFVRVLDIQSRNGVRYTYKIHSGGDTPPTFLRAIAKTRLQVNDLQLRNGPYDLRVALSRESNLPDDDEWMQRNVRMCPSKNVSFPPGYRRVKSRLRVRADELFVYDLTKVNEDEKGALYEVEVEFCPAPGTASSTRITELVIYKILHYALQLTRIDGLTGTDE